MVKLNETFRNLENSISDCYLERDEVAHGLVVAMLSRHHLFLVGPPGTAKSAMVNWLANRIDGSSYFAWLLNRFSALDELFGPVDLGALENGSYRRITTGKLPETSFAFLDEIFKANSAILNSLLSILQERVFHNDGTPTKCPLETCVGASNELPEEDEALEALFDRFMLRFTVNYIADSGTFKNLLQGEGKPSKTPPQISQEELGFAQDEVTVMPIGDDTYDALVQLRENLGREGIVVSDRRFVQLLTILRAEAWLRGDPEVTAKNLPIAGHCLWTRPEDARKVMGIVLQVCDPYAFKAQATLEAAEEAASKVMGMDASDDEITLVGNEAHAKLKGYIMDLEEIADKSDRAQDALTRVKKLNNEIVRRAFHVEL